MRYRCLLACCLFLAACNGSNETDRIALLRVVHTSPDAPPLTLFVDDDAYVEDLRYLESSDYMDIDEGSHSFEVNRADGFALYLDFTASFQNDAQETLLLTDTADDMRRILIEDDNSEPSDGRAKLRIVNASVKDIAESRRNNIDVYITSPDESLDDLIPSPSNLSEGRASGYLQNAAGEYRVRITPVDSKVVIGDSGTFSVDEGQIRTIVIADATSGDLPRTMVFLKDRN